MKEGFFAYQGEIFAIEWYFDANGKSPAFDYYQKLQANQKVKFFHLIHLLGDIGKIRNIEKFRYEGDQIYALKIPPDRFLCFFSFGAKIIITNAYKKKTDKMPLREKQKALKAKEDYIRRNSKEKHYE